MESNLKHRNEPTPALPENGGRGFLEPMDFSTAAGLVSETLRHLPEIQRMALILRYYDGFSPPRIAGILECSQQDAEELLHRARDTLYAGLSARARRAGNVPYPVTQALTRRALALLEAEWTMPPEMEQAVASRLAELLADGK